MADERTEMAELVNVRLVIYGCILAAITAMLCITTCLGTGGVADCAKACGDGRFKRYTDSYLDGSDGHRKPAQCECIDGAK